MIHVAWVWVNNYRGYVPPPRGLTQRAEEMEVTGAADDDALLERVVAAGRRVGDVAHEGDDLSVARPARLGTDAKLAEHLDAVGDELEVDVREDQLGARGNDEVARLYGQQSQQNPYHVTNSQGASSTHASTLEYSLDSRAIRVRALSFVD